MAIAKQDKYEDKTISKAVKHHYIDNTKKCHYEDKKLQNQSLYYLHV